MRRDLPAGGGQTNGTERTNAGTGDLAMRIVEYPDAPDRCTIYPTQVTEHERMTHWISADREAFLALDQLR